MDNSPFTGKPYVIPPDRKPCSCGGRQARLITSGGQDGVWCIVCDKHLYNAPKTETGRKPRTVTTVHEAIKPKQRSRILLRASKRCELCGKHGNLHVGHLVSVDAGMKLGMTDRELNGDENLCCLCDECNLGLGKEPMPLRLAVAMILTREGDRLSGPPQVGEHTGGTEEPPAMGTLEDGGKERQGNEGSLFDQWE